MAENLLPDSDFLNTDDGAFVFTEAPLSLEQTPTETDPPGKKKRKGVTGWNFKDFEFTLSDFAQADDTVKRGTTRGNMQFGGMFAGVRVPNQAQEAANIQAFVNETKKQLPFKSKAKADAITANAGFVDDFADEFFGGIEDILGGGKKLKNFITTDVSGQLIIDKGAVSQKVDEIVTMNGGDRYVKEHYKSAITQIAESYLTLFEAAPAINKRKPKTITEKGFKASATELANTTTAQIKSEIDAEDRLYRQKIVGLQQEFEPVLADLGMDAAFYMENVAKEVQGQMAAEFQGMQGVPQATLQKEYQNRVHQEFKDRYGAWMQENLQPITDAYVNNLRGALAKTNEARNRIVGENKKIYEARQKAYTEQIDKNNQQTALDFAKVIDEEVKKAGIKRQNFAKAYSGAMMDASFSPTISSQIFGDAFTSAFGGLKNKTGLLLNAIGFEADWIDDMRYSGQTTEVRNQMAKPELGDGWLKPGYWAQSLGTSAPAMLPSIAATVLTANPYIGAVVGVMAEGTELSGGVIENVANRTGDWGAAAEAGKQAFVKNLPTYIPEVLMQRMFSPLRFAKGSTMSNVKDFGLNVVGEGLQERWQTAIELSTGKGAEFSTFGSAFMSKEANNAMLEGAGMAAIMGGAGMANSTVMNAFFGGKNIPHIRSQAIANTILKGNEMDAVAGVQIEAMTTGADDITLQAGITEVQNVGKMVADAQAIGLNGPQTQVYVAQSSELQELQQKRQAVQDPVAAEIIDDQIAEKKKEIAGVVKGETPLATIQIADGVVFTGTAPNIGEMLSIPEIREGVKMGAFTIMTNDSKVQKQVEELMNEGVQEQAPVEEVTAPTVEQQDDIADALLQQMPQVEGLWGKFLEQLVDPGTHAFVIDAVIDQFNTDFEGAKARYGDKVAEMVQPFIKDNSESQIDANTDDTVLGGQQYKTIEEKANALVREEEGFKIFGRTFGAGFYYSDSNDYNNPKGPFKTREEAIADFVNTQPFLQQQPESQVTPLQNEGESQGIALQNEDAIIENIIVKSTTKKEELTPEEQVYYDSNKAKMNTLIGERVRQVFSSPAKETKQKTEPVQKTELGAVIEGYDNGNIATINDFVNEVEAIANDNGMMPLIEAVEKFRMEQEQDFKLSGRNDMDAAESAFINAVRNYNNQNQNNDGEMQGQEGRQEVAPSQVQEPPVGEQPTNNVGGVTAPNVSSTMNIIPEARQTWKGRDVNVVYNNKGRRVVKYKNGKPVDPESSTYKNALKKQAENYRYNIGTKADVENIPQGMREDEANSWVIENSNNPSEIADIYLNLEKQPTALSSVEFAIAQYGVGKIKPSSFYEFNDKNRVTNALARTYFSKNGRTLDQISQELSYDGGEITAEEISDFMVRFPFGVDPDRMVETEVHQKAKERFEQLTGIPLTKKTAAIAAQQLATEQQIMAAIKEVGKKYDEGTMPMTDEAVSTWMGEEAANDYDEETFDNVENLPQYEQDITGVGEGAEQQTPTERATGESATGQEGSVTGTAAPTADSNTPSQQEAKVREAKAALDKAQRELTAAENKLAKEQGTQADIFGNAAVQNRMFDDRGDNKDILDPLRNKVKEAQAAYDQAVQGQENAVMEGQPELGFDNKEQLRKGFLNKTAQDFEIYNNLPKNKRQQKLNGMAARLQAAKRDGIITEEDFDNIKQRIDRDYEELGSDVRVDAIEVPDISMEDLGLSNKYFEINGQSDFYHASPKKRSGRLVPSQAEGFGVGVYFSTNKDEVISEFGEFVTTVKLNILKPLFTGTKEWNTVIENAVELADLDYGKRNGLELDEEKGYFKYNKEDSNTYFDIPSNFISTAAKSKGYDAIIDKGQGNYENEIVVLDESKILYEEDIKQSSTKEKADALAEKILAMRKSNDRLYSFPFPVAVYNGMLSTIANVIKAGGSIAEAFEKAIAYVKEKTNADDKRVRDVVKQQFDVLGLKMEEPQPAPQEQAPPPTEPPQEPQQQKPEGFERKEGKKSVLNRAVEGLELTGDEILRRKIASYGLFYDVKRQEEANMRARQIVDDIGIDKAIEAYQKYMIVGDVATLVMFNVLDKISEMVVAAASQGNSAQVDKLQNLEAFAINALDLRGRTAGEEISAFNFGYKNSEFQFRLSNQIQEYKNKNGGVIPDAVKEKFEQWDKELQKEKQEVERLRKENEALRGQEVVDEIKKRQKQNKAKVTIFSEKAEKFAAFLDKGKINRPGMFMSQALPIPWDAAIDAVKLAVKGVAKLADAAATGFNVIKESDWYKSLTNDQQKQAEKEFTDFIFDQFKKFEAKEAYVNEKGEIKIPDALIRGLVEGGIDNINDLVAAIKDMVIEDFPDVTDREIRDAITNYGKVLNMSQDDISQTVRKIKRIGKLVSQMEDIEEGKRPKRSGLQRDKPDAEERKLMKEVREAMKGLPMDDVTAARELKTALDAIKTRLRNRIEELQNAIADNEEIVKTERSVQLDDEAMQLREQVDELKKLYDQTFGSPVTDDVLLDRLIKATDRSIEKLEKQIRENDIAYKEKRQLTSPELEARRKARNDLKAQLEQMRKDAGIAEKRMVQQQLKRLEKSEAEYIRRIKEGDFSKKAPKSNIQNDELTKARARVIAVQEKFATEQYKNELRNRGTAQRFKDGIIELLGLGRVLQATFDLSFMAIQGLMPTAYYVFKNWSRIGEAFKQAMRSFASEKFFNEYEQLLKAQGYYPVVKGSGVAVSRYDSKLTAAEELGLTGWATAMWEWLTYPTKFISPKLYEGFKKYNPLKMFERAGVGYLNAMRVNLFLDHMKILQDKGMQFETHPIQYKMVADVVNVYSQRATLPMNMESMSKAAAVMYYSPRNFYSVLIQTTPLFFYYYNKWGAGQPITKPTVAQKLALAQYMSMITLTVSGVLAAALYYNNDDDDETGVDFDPRSTKFMKIKIGNSYVDPFGGRLQMIVWQSRIITELMATAGRSDYSYVSSSGEKSRLGQGTTPNMGEISARILQNKLSPVFGKIWEGMNADLKLNKETGQLERYTFGEKYDALKSASDLTHPLLFGTIKELYKEQPATVATYLSAIAALGINVSTYKPKEKKAKGGRGR